MRLATVPSADAHENDAVPSVRLVLDPSLIVCDATAVGDTRGLDLRSMLGRPAVEMFATTAREPLTSALQRAAEGTPSRLPASMVLGDRQSDCIVQVTPGERFIHLSAEPVSTESSPGSGPDRHLEYVGMVASRLAHDFNDLMAAILVNTEALQDASDDPQCIQAISTELRTAAEHARGLISQLLNGNSTSEEPQSTVDLAALTRDMSQLLQASTPPNVVLCCDHEEQEHAVMGQPQRLRHLLLNLMVNASEAIGEDVGAIMLSTRMIEADAALVSLTRTRSIPPSGRYVCIEIEDTGPGLTVEKARRIFDPSFSTKHPHQGVGLSDCLNIVEQHGGALLLDSVPGNGARFRVLLPVATKKPKTSVAPSDLAGRRVLVIDDNDLIRMATDRALRSQGCEVLPACDGLQGIEIFEQQHGALDLVLLDTDMPYVSGSDVFDDLRRIDPSVPIVFISDRSAEDAPTCSARAEGFIAKPFRRHELLHAMTQVIGNSARVLS